MHPAVLVTAGFFWILLIQRVESGALGLVAGLSMLVGCLVARAALWKVLRRMRYIFLALLVFSAWDSPGRLLVPLLGSFSPSLDGLLLFFWQAVRLAGVVSVVAILLGRLSSADWIGSFVVLTSPLRYLGVSTDRAAVRLRLVLEYAERNELDWRCLLQAQGESAETRSLLLEQADLSFRDGFWLVFVFVLFGVWCWHG